MTPRFAARLAALEGVVECGISVCAEILAGNDFEKICRPLCPSMELGQRY